MLRFKLNHLCKNGTRVISVRLNTQIAKFMGPTWGPPGSCRPQMGPMLAPWTLLSGTVPSYQCGDSHYENKTAKTGPKMLLAIRIHTNNMNILLTKLCLVTMVWWIIAKIAFIACGLWFYSRGWSAQYVINEVAISSPTRSHKNMCLVISEFNVNLSATIMMAALSEPMLNH